jgi:hypothetical protein
MPPAIANAPPIPVPDEEYFASGSSVRNCASALLSESVGRQTAIEGEMKLTVSPADTPTRAGGIIWATVDAAASR